MSYPDPGPMRLCPECLHMFNWDECHYPETGLCDDCAHFGPDEDE